MDAQHSIFLAAKRSGLTPHLIRAWEKRYDAVSPNRTGTNRRLYSEEEIDRLRLLGILRNQGHRIGDIARLPTASLRDLTLSSTDGEVLTDSITATFSAPQAVEESVEHVRAMDADALGLLLDRSSVILGQRGVLERLISPLARRIGVLWADGSLTAAHEHFASNELRSFLLRASHRLGESRSAPLLVVATPAGQIHELGAAIATATARDLGWRVLYLGANLPAADIAAAATANTARAVALSLVYPGDDRELPGELQLLRKLLPAETDLVVGGEAAGNYQAVLVACGAILINDLTRFADYLTGIRLPVRRNG